MEEWPYQAYIELVAVSILIIHAFLTFDFFGVAFFFWVVGFLTPLSAPFFEVVTFLVVVAFLGAGVFFLVVAFLGVEAFLVTAAFLGAGVFLVAVAFFGAGFFTTFLGTAFFTTFFGFGAGFFASGLSLYEPFTCGYIGIVR